MPIVDAWRLPQLRAAVPHGVLDMLRAKRLLFQRRHAVDKGGRLVPVCISNMVRA